MRVTSYCEGRDEVEGAAARKGVSMSVDPTDPDTFEDVYEDEAEEESVDFEATPEDAAEQHADLLRRREQPMTERGNDEVNPADAAEQALEVETNEDEYR